MHRAIVERLPPPYPLPYRLYSGFAGWMPGQLQRELELDGWHVLPASEALVFRHDTSDMWRELVDRAAAKRTRSENVTDVAVR